MMRYQYRFIYIDRDDDGFPVHDEDCVNSAIPMTWREITQHWERLNRKIGLCYFRPVELKIKHPDGRDEICADVPAPITGEF